MKDALILPVVASLIVGVNVWASTGSFNLAVAAFTFALFTFQYLAIIKERLEK